MEIFLAEKKEVEKKFGHIRRFQSSSIWHSSEMSGLCLMKYFIKMHLDLAVFI